MARRNGAGPEKGKPVTGEKSGAGAIVEFHRIGNSVKVSAVDTETHVEVSIVAPASSSERQMTDAVLKKLQYVLARKNMTR